MQAKNMRLINIAIELINTAQDDEVRNELVYQDIKDGANGKEPEEPKKSYLNADDLNKLFETVSVDEHNEPIKSHDGIWKDLKFREMAYGKESIPEQDIAEYKPLEDSIPKPIRMFSIDPITIHNIATNLNITREEALDKLCNDEEFFPLDERLTLIGDELSKIHSTLTEKISKDILHMLANNICDLYKLANSIKEHNVGRTLNDYGVVSSQINNLKNVIFELTGSYYFITESLDESLLLLRRKGDTATIIKHAPCLDNILVIIDELYRIQREY